ncbi:MAG: (Fe-S)-binding protein [Acidimicrobiales bacterium]
MSEPRHGAEPAGAGLGPGRDQAPFGAFDAHHPPSAQVIADCVHCGFCLPACPTYALWGEEMDSPRGRILLMRSALEGEIGLDRTFVAHLDACLGCMACVTACPSGVRYDELIEATRAQIERHHRRPLADRAFRELVFALFPHPGRVRLAAAAGLAYQRLGLAGLVRRRGLLDRMPARLRALEGLMPAVRPGSLVARVPELTPAVGERRARVGLVTGCVQRVFFDRVNAATVRVLAAEGCEVVAPRTQGCCGALMVHAGREAQAVAAARALVDAFEGTGVDAVVVNAAGCGSTLKDYGRLLADDPVYGPRAAALAAKARDVTEVLAGLEPRVERRPLGAAAPARGVAARVLGVAGPAWGAAGSELGTGGSGRRSAPVRVAYHDACHLAHAQGVRAEPRALLSSIPGLELVELAHPDRCCGSAGIYNLVEPEPAEELGRAKAADVLAAGVDVVATANPGCLLQLHRYLGDEVSLVHPVELVDASIAGRNPLRRLRSRP